jgi:hypothetical protein
VGASFKVSSPAPESSRDSSEVAKLSVPRRGPGTWPLGGPCPAGKAELCSSPAAAWKPPETHVQLPILGFGRLFLGGGGRVGEGRT